jgi:hypothetical protein
MRGRMLLILVMVGLLYDNGVLSIGTWLGAGEQLESLHAWRYWAHAFLTPLLVIVSYDILRQERLPIAGYRFTANLVWVLTIALIAYQSFLAQDEVRHLRAVREFGIIHYTPAVRSGMPIMIIAVTLILLFTGIVLILYRGWWWLGIGVALMPFIMWLELPLGGRAWANVAEFVLTFTIWTTLERKLPRRIFT